jgi:hypothetical protein
MKLSTLAVAAVVTLAPASRVRAADCSFTGRMIREVCRDYDRGVREEDVLKSVENAEQTPAMKEWASGEVVGTYGLRNMGESCQTIIAGSLMLCLKQKENATKK